MSNSVFKVVDLPPKDMLLIYVSEDGKISPDKEYMQRFVAYGGRNIKIMQCKKSDAGGMHIEEQDVVVNPEDFSYEKIINFLSDNTDNERNSEKHEYILKLVRCDENMTQEEASPDSGSSTIAPGDESYDIIQEIDQFLAEFKP